MLTLAGLTLAIIAIALGFGIQTSRILGVSLARDPGDRFFLAVWIGLAVLGGILTAAALLVPIGTAAFIVVLAAGAVALLVGRRAVGDVLDGLSLRAGCWVPVVTLVMVSLAAALVASKDVSHTDTGIYHLPQMIWLEQTGLIPGLALLHHRFGYNSIWLALAAPVAGLGADFRFVAIGGAVVFALLAFQAVYSTARLATGQGRLADWYFLGALVPASSRDVISHVVSSSPDFAVYAMVVIFGWTLLVDDDRRLAAAAAMLAIGAVAIKLSAVPLVVGAGCYLLSSARHRWRNGLAAFLFAVPTLGSVLAANFVTSGCPAFPAAVVCLPVPWAVPVETVQAVSNFISQWPLLGNYDPLTAHDIRDYASGHLPVLSSSERLGRLTAFISGNELALLGAILVLAIALAWRLKSASALALVGTGLLGLAFTAVAPSYRFAAGWLGVLVGAAAALLASAHPTAMTSVERLARMVHVRSARQAMLLAGALVMVVAAFVLASVSKTGDRDLRESGFVGRPTPLFDRIVLPPPIVPRQPSPHKGTISGVTLPLSEPLQTVPAKDHDVLFVRPQAGEQCWSIRRPCTPGGEPLHPFRLRDPARGLSAGFVLGDVAGSRQ
jgi:hypothetical protein